MIEVTAILAALTARSFRQLGQLHHINLDEVFGTHSVGERALHLT
jgi:hypothetical protein